MTPTAAWTELQNRLAEISTLSQIASNLSWDQQVMMPSGGGPDRGTQLALLSGMSHARWNEPALAEALDEMENRALVAETLGDHLFEWFLRNKRHEWADYKSQVTQFELDSYFSRL